MPQEPAAGHDGYGGMKHPRTTTSLAVALLLTTMIGACSVRSDEEEGAAPAAQGSATPAPVVTPAPTDAATAPTTLTLAGLGALKLGQAPDAASGWAERGAQASDTCRLVSNPDFPGVYGIVEGGRVARVTVAGQSPVTFVEGIGVGSTRAQVDGAFPGFAEEPHKYVDGGVYLTAPNAASGDPAVRLELDATGKVTSMHVGVMPVLAYVEGCS